MSPVLNSPGFWIYLSFWMCQSFEYVKFLNLPLVLNMPRFLIYHSSEYARVIQDPGYAWIIPEYLWICLIMSMYAWICMNMPEYARICLDPPEWLLFLHFSISLFVLQSLFYLNTWLLIWTVDRRLEAIVWRNMRLLSWLDNIWFFL